MLSKLVAEIAACRCRADFVLEHRFCGPLPALRCPGGPLTEGAMLSKLRILKKLIWTRVGTGACCGPRSFCDGFDPNRCRDQNRRSVGDKTATQEPPPIRQLSAPDLRALLESGTAIELVDVRTEEERAIARIDGSRLLDQACHDALILSDPDTPIVFQCHHGIRSQHAAEYFQRHGFRNLYNLQGGIDAWSLLVDASVPRY